MVQKDLPLCFGVFREQPETSLAKGGLAGARFTHQGKALPLPDLQAHLLNGLNAVIPVSVNNAEILEGQAHAISRACFP